MSKLETITSDTDPQRLVDINTTIASGLEETMTELLHKELVSSNGEALSAIISFSVQFLSNYSKEGALELLAGLCSVINDGDLQ